MRVGYYQFRPLFGRPDHNCEKIVTALAAAEADLVVLPELALSGYSFKDKNELMKYAEDPAASRRLEKISDLARTRACYFIIGFAEREGARCFNSAALIGPAGIAHIYRKAHLFNAEKFLFEPGNTGFTVHEVKGMKIGMLICFDWVFPEAARVLALKGAQLICQPANLVLAYCQQTMLARCIENGIFAITANRYGAEKRPHGSLKFTGQSQIAAPGGKLLRRAAARREELYITDINPRDADNKMITEHNGLLADRRPEFYRALNASGAGQ